MTITIMITITIFCFTYLIAFHEFHPAISRPLQGHEFHPGGARGSRRRQRFVEVEDGRRTTVQIHHRIFFRDLFSHVFVRRFFVPGFCKRGGSVLFSSSHCFPTGSGSVLFSFCTVFARFRAVRMSWSSSKTCTRTHTHTQTYTDRHRHAQTYTYTHTHIHTYNAENKRCRNVESSRCGLQRPDVIGSVFPLNV